MARLGLRAVIALLLNALGSSLLAAEPVDYLRQVKPLLTVRCYACHGALQQKGGLRVDTGLSLRAGSDHGPVVVLGKSGESLLIAQIQAKEFVALPNRNKGLPEVTTAAVSEKACSL